MNTWPKDSTGCAEIYHNGAKMRTYLQRKQNCSTTIYKPLTYAMDRGIKSIESDRGGMRPAVEEKKEIN